MKANNRLSRWNVEALDFRSQIDAKLHTFEPV